MAEEIDHALLKELDETNRISTPKWGWIKYVVEEWHYPRFSSEEKFKDYLLDQYSLLDNSKDKMSDDNYKEAREAIPFNAAYKHMNESYTKMEIEWTFNDTNLLRKQTTADFRSLMEVPTDLAHNGQIQTGDINKNRIQIEAWNGNRHSIILQDDAQEDKWVAIIGGKEVDFGFPPIDINAPPLLELRDKVSRIELEEDESGVPIYRITLELGPRRVEAIYDRKSGVFLGSETIEFLGEETSIYSVRKSISNLDGKKMIIPTRIEYKTYLVANREKRLVEHQRLTVVDVSFYDVPPDKSFTPDIPENSHVMIYKGDVLVVDSSGDKLHMKELVESLDFLEDSDIEEVRAVVNGVRARSKEESEDSDHADKLGDDKAASLNHKITSYFLFVSIAVVATIALASVIYTRRHRK